MVKAKQRAQHLSKTNFSCSSSKSKQTACCALTRNTVLSHRRRKRKVGVTLVSVLKKKQSPVESLFSEAVNDATVKQKANTLVHKKHEYSNKYRPHSDVKSLSYSTSESVNCCKPDIILCPNDTVHSYARTSSSSRFSPEIIDDTSDTDHSSVADTTNVFSTSAVSETGNTDDVDYFAEDNCRITHGLG